MTHNSVYSAITKLANHYRQTDRITAGLIAEKGPALIDRLEEAGDVKSRADGFRALERVASLSSEIAAATEGHKGRFFDSCFDLIERGEDRCIVYLAEAFAVDRTFEHEKPFQALVDTMPEIIRKGGAKVLSSIAAIGNNMSHVTWQISHAVDFIREMPQTLERLNRIYGEAQILKFYAMLERLSTNQYNFNGIVANLDEYLDGLEKCREMGISDRVLDLTDRLADADSSQTLDIFPFWIGFVRSVYGVNIRSKSGVPHPEFIRSENRDGLGKLLDRIAAYMTAHPVSAAYLIGYSGRIIELIGYDGLDTVVRSFIHRIPTPTERMAQAYLEVLKASPEVIGALLHFGDRKFVTDTFRAAGRLNDCLLLSESLALLRRTPQITGSIGLDGFEKILELYRKAMERVSRRADTDYDFVLLVNDTPAILNAIGQYGGKQMALDMCRQAEGLAVYGPKLPYALLMHAPEILQIEGMTGVEKVSGIISRVSDNELIAGCLIKSSPAIISRLGYTGIAYLARLGRRIAKHNESAALIFISNLPLHLSKLDSKGLAKLADKIIETSIVHRKNAELLAKGETQEYLDFCDFVNDGLHLKHVRHILANYLKALLGYRIEISPSPSADTDGNRIYLPKVIQEFADDEKNLLMYKVLATHVEAHIEFGSFDFLLSKAPGLVADVKGRYSLDIRQEGSGSQEELFFSLFPEPGLIRNLKDIFEDYRIESRLKAVYPVLGRDILRMNRHMLQSRPALEELKGNKEKTVEVLCRLLSAGKANGGIPGQIQQVVDQALQAAEPLESSDASIQDSFCVAADVYHLIDDAFEDPYEETEPFSSPIDQSGFNENVGSFSETADRISELMAIQDTRPSDEDDDPGDSQNSGDPEETAEPPAQDRRELDSLGSENDGSNQPSQEELSEEIRQMLLQLFKEKQIKPKEIERDIEALDRDELIEYLKRLMIAEREEKDKSISSKRFLYPEWGNDINAYRALWTTVIERRLQGHDPEFYRETMERYGGLVKRIRREFQVLRPEAHVKLKRQFDGNDIDFDAVVDYQIDLILRNTPSEKNYIQTLKRHRDIAVAFLIDLSGSTSGNTIKCEKQSLIMLSEALNELKDTFAIYGFTGYTKDRIDFYTVKDFQEPYDKRIKQRISGLAAGSNTREGAAIRHVTSKLKPREERSKILILLNDSQPFDEGYHGDYAIADTRMALFEAKKSGVKPFSLTITRNSRHLKELYSHNSWVVIDDIAKLPEKITRIYQKLTT